MKKGKPVKYRVYMNRKQMSIIDSPFREFTNKVDTEAHVRYLNKAGMKPHVKEVR